MLGTFFARAHPVHPRRRSVSNVNRPEILRIGTAHKGNGINDEGIASNSFVIATKHEPIASNLFPSACDSKEKRTDWFLSASDCFVIAPAHKAIGSRFVGIGMNWFMLATDHKSTGWERFKNESEVGQLATPRVGFDCPPKPPRLNQRLRPAPAFGKARRRDGRAGGEEVRRLEFFVGRFPWFIRVCDRAADRADA